MPPVHGSGVCPLHALHILHDNDHHSMDVREVRVAVHGGLGKLLRGQHLQKHKGVYDKR